MKTAKRSIRRLSFRSNGMLEFTLWGISFRIRVWFPVLCLTLLYMDDSGLVMTALVAALWHELGHVTSLVLYGDCPERIELSAFGVRFDVDYENIHGGYGKDIALALAGPMMNILAWLFCAGRYPVIAAVHLMLGTWNLLPLYPLDGERVLCAVLTQYCSPSLAGRLRRIFFWITWIACFALSLGLLLYHSVNLTIWIMTMYTGIAELQRYLNSL